MLTLILTSPCPELPQRSAPRRGRAFFIPCWTTIHTFDGKERPGYLASLVSVTEHCGTLYVCASVIKVPIPARTSSDKKS